MELIYVWIEEYRNITKQAFMISNIFDIVIEDYENDKNGKAKYIQLKERALNEGKKDFFSNKISNITAIIGMNSVGKSNIISCIGDVLTSVQYSKFILIYFDKQTGKCILECNNICITVDKETILKPFFEMNKIYKTDIYNYDYKNKIIEIARDVSSTVEYITIKETINEMMYPNANALCSDIYRYGLSYKNSGKLLPYEYLTNRNKSDENINNNSDVHIVFEIQNRFGHSKDYLFKLLPECYENEKFYYDENCNNERCSYKRLYMWRFLERTINLFKFIDDKIIREEENKTKKLKDIDITKDYNIIKDFIINIRRKHMEKKMENQIDIETSFKGFIDSMENLINEVPEEYFLNTYSFSIPLALVQSNKELNNHLNNVLMLLDKEEVSSEFLVNKLFVRYDNLSDGLYEKLKLFSSIDKCIKQNDANKYSNVILLLDEPDLHMHPEWSRRLLSEIIQYVENLNYNNKFQIIFSTHSPFMISDMPNENIIFLEKDVHGKTKVVKKSYETFGANIHSLLKNNFFMKSTMGEFALNKIKLVVEELIENSQNNKIHQFKKKQIEYIIEVIGEPIIKGKLEQIFENSNYKDLVNEEKQEKEICTIAASKLLGKNKGRGFRYHRKQETTKKIKKNSNKNKRKGEA